ncbi:MAG: hypothetical protein IS860_06150 [Nitrosopumilus sp.]|nr:hypothetical protein [Nitrosopumilus sp.]MCE2506342.1 hypothetical protein [Nitrosopumilaceae archaeon]
MSKRVTVMIDDENDRKLRLKQAKEIQKTQKSISFSKVLNDTLRTGFSHK